MYAYQLIRLFKILFCSICISVKCFINLVFRDRRENIKPRQFLPGFCVYKSYLHQLWEKLTFILYLTLTGLLLTTPAFHLGDSMNTRTASLSVSLVKPLVTFTSVN